jgi:hypothetical protein
LTWLDKTSAERGSWWPFWRSPSWFPCFINYPRPPRPRPLGRYPFPWPFRT